MRGRVAALLVAGACLGTGTVAVAQEPPPDDRFDVTLLDKNITQGIRIATAPDGRVFLAERDGRLKVFKPDTGTTVVAGQIPTGTNGELGFVGLAVAPDFATTKHLYAHYVPLAPPYNTSRDLARLALHDQRRHARPGVREADLQRPAPGLRGWRAQRRRPAVRAQRRPLHRHRRQHRLLRVGGLPADGRAPRPDAQRRAGDLGEHEQPERQDPAHPSARGARGDGG